MALPTTFRRQSQRAGSLHWSNCLLKPSPAITSHHQLSSWFIRPLSLIVGCEVPLFLTLLQHVSTIVVHLVLQCLSVKKNNDEVESSWVALIVALYSPRQLSLGPRRGSVLFLDVFGWLAEESEEAGRNDVVGCPGLATGVVPCSPNMSNPLGVSRSKPSPDIRMLMNSPPSS